MIAALVLSILFAPRPSPDGSKVAFVRGHEPWVADLATGTTRRITSGAEGLVTHADTLFAAGRPFELVPLAGQTHLFYEPQPVFRYRERVFDFFEANLDAGARRPRP